MKSRKHLLTLLLTPVLLLALLLPVSGAVIAQAGCGSTYVVQQGDTLSSIATQCNVSVQQLYQLNPFLNNSGLVYPGWVLDLPQAGAGGVIIPNTGAPNRDAFYVVRAGDTLSYLARRLSVSTQDLLSANPNLQENQPLQRGEILRLPGTLNQPAAIVSPYVVEPGQTVTLEAAGFAPNTQVAILGGQPGQSGTALAQVQTNNQGDARATLQVPTWAQRGNRWILVAQSVQNTSVTAKTNEMYIVDTNGPNEPIEYTVRFNDTLSTIAAQFGVTLNEILAVNPQITNPRVIYTGQNILIPGPQMRQNVREGKATIVITPNAGPPGTQVDVFAVGLPVNMSTDIRVGYNDNQASAIFSKNMQSSSRGTIRTTVVIPATVNINDTLVVTADPENDMGITPPSQLFYVSQNSIPTTGQNNNGQPTVQLSPRSGTPGARVLVIATGYPANIPVEVGVGQSGTAGEYTLQMNTGPQGQLFTTVTIPQAVSAGQQVIITVAPPQNMNASAAQATFLVTSANGQGQQTGQPAVQLVPSSGPPGSQVQVIATGFPANAPVRLQVGQSSAAAEYTLQLNTDPQGSVNTYITIPESINTGNPFTITAAAMSGGGGYAQANFQVTEPVVPVTGNNNLPALSLAPASGPPGTVFTINVSGYPANTPVSLGIGLSKMAPDMNYQYNTGQDGALSIRVQAPQGAQPGTFYGISITPQPNGGGAPLPRLQSRFQVTQP